MIPPDDDPEFEADLALRRWTVVRALTELAIARAQELDDAQVRVYTEGLIDIDSELLVAACGYLGKQKRRDGETALPSIGDIRDRCWQIRRDEQRAAEDRAFEDTYRRDRDVLPQARAEMWMAHLRTVLQAKKLGHIPPPNPEPLDTRTVTYKCVFCYDTGFMRVCECGKRSCAECRYQRHARCACRPQPAPHVPPEPKAARPRRGTGWHRSGE